MYNIYPIHELSQKINITFMFSVFAVFRVFIKCINSLFNLPSNSNFVHTSKVYTITQSNELIKSV